MKKQLLFCAFALLSLFVGKVSATIIDTKITGFKYDPAGTYFGAPAPEVTFTVQMQAGLGYVQGSDLLGNWSALQMTWDFYTQPGVVLNFAGADVENVAPANRAASASLVYSVPGFAVAGSNGGLLQLVLTRTISATNTATNTARDVPAAYVSYATVHIPVISGVATNATKIYQRITLSNIDGGSFWGNSAPTSLLNQPFTTNAPGPGPGAPLPITLVSFEAKKASATRAQLNWKTSMEQGSDYFEVERSTDGKTFATSVRRMAAAGNSTSPLDYQTYDNEPAQGVNYYRLKMVDASGKYAYSEVRTVTFGDVRSYAISPNPAKEFINVTGMNTGASIMIMSTTGQVISNTKAEGTSEKITITSMVPGMYYVQIVQDGAIVFNDKFIKQ